MTTKTRAYTQEEIIALFTQFLAVTQASQPKQPKVVAKVAKKAVAKPTTYTAAIAGWKVEKGITPAAEAQFKAENEAFKALKDARYAADWAIWTSSPERNALAGQARKDANHKVSVDICNAYRLELGQKHRLASYK